MPNGWVKCFTDDTVELGWDELIEIGDASWSKGKLDEISSVIVWHDKKYLCFNGQGNYWQSDTMTAELFNPQPEYLQRSVYKEISPKDTVLVVSEDKGQGVVFELQEELTKPNGWQARHRCVSFPIDNREGEWVEAILYPDGSYTFDFKTAEEMESYGAISR